MVNGRVMPLDLFEIFTESWRCRLRYHIPQDNSCRHNYCGTYIPQPLSMEKS